MVATAEQKGDAVLANSPQLRRPLLLTCTLLVGVSSSSFAQEAPATPESSAPPTAAHQTDDPVRDRGAAYARLGRALFAIRGGEYGQAVEEIHGALAMQPDSAGLAVQAAELMMMMHRDGEAERLARRALTLDPGAREAMLFLADMGYERARRSPAETKDRREAIRLYDEFVKSASEPVDPEVLRRLAHLWILDRNIEQAIATGQRLVDERPGDRQATMMLTELLIQAERRQDGLEVLLRYLAVHPWDDELREWGTDLIDEFDGWALVEPVFTPHLPLRADDTGLNLFYAQALERTGRPARAAEVLERALVARPGDVQLKRNLVVVYRRLGRMADSVALIRELITADVEEPLYQVWLADTLEKQGDLDGALRAYEAAVEGLGVDPASAEQRDAFRQRIVMLRLAQDDAAGALEALLALEQSDSASAWEARARLAITTKDWAEARQAARRLKSAGGDETAGAAALLEGEIALGERRYSEATEHFEEAVRLLPSRVRVRVAEMYRTEERTKQAEQLLREWVELEPQEAEPLYHLGAFLYQTDRVEESERSMRQAIALDASHAPALNFLGYSLAERSEQLEEALALVERALAVDSYNGAYLDSLGWVYYQMGRYGEARPPLERAVRELPRDPTVLEHLGDLYSRLGERDLAMNAWTRALEAGPEDAALLEDKLERARAGGGDNSGDRGARDKAEARTSPADSPLPR